MREVAADTIKKTVAELCKKAAYDLPSEVYASISRALEQETSKLGREILREILQNAKIARKKRIPLCQDTGIAVVFVNLGQEVSITGGGLYKAINDGIELGYKNLRKSVVSCPLGRKNLMKNTPAQIHVEIVPGDKLKIIILPKGGGAENASFVKMFLPTASKEEIADYIVKKVKENGPKACPPLILGIGIGGSFDAVSYLAKKSLLRPIGSRNGEKDIAEFEKYLLEKVNNTEVGPMGVGGKTTALAVHIETSPCHIANLPVAVNFQCHSHRHAEAEL